MLRKAFFFFFFHSLRLSNEVKILIYVSKQNFPNDFVINCLKIKMHLPLDLLIEEQFF